METISQFKFTDRTQRAQSVERLGQLKRMLREIPDDTEFDMKRWMHKRTIKRVCNTAGCAAGNAGLARSSST